MSIAEGSRVRIDGRDDLGVGDVAEVRVGEVVHVRVNWPSAGHATIEHPGDLIDVSEEAARGNRWLSD